MERNKPKYNLKSLKKLFSFYSLYNTELNITIRVFTIIAIAGAIGNTLGFAANLALYGWNFITAFCAACDLLIILNLIFGLRSKYNISLGYLMLFILDVLEFPLLTFAYGAVMYPYMIIGFHGLAMVSEKNRRMTLCLGLGIYDTAIVIISNVHPYMFGPQDSMGLLGSAISAFVISLYTVVSLVVMWQNVYLVDTIENDTLTGTYSQIGFNKNAERILKSDSDKEYILMYFNIRNFKTANSIFGIDGGNKLLTEIGEYIYHADFAPRIVGRLNSDRFVALAEKQNFNPDTMEEFCEYAFGDNSRNISAVINCGIYEIKDRSIPVGSMCDRANAALRFIRSSGRRFYAVYDREAEESFREETELLAEIENAISENQFEPFYQPVVDCETGKIVSAEALARWKHPEYGIIKPGMFIPVLERKELISDLDIVIARQVKTLISLRRVEEKAMIPVSINLSRMDLYDRKFMTDLEKMLKDSSRSCNMFKFEVTESAYEELNDMALGKLSKLRELGAQLLVDDFGSGYSSLGTITDYDYDIIKLDIQFARRITTNEKVVTIVRGLIEIIHKMGCKVIAEGIETKEQFEAIKACGCDYIQGYYFYPPLSEREFIELLDKQ